VRGGEEIQDKTTHCESLGGIGKSFTRSSSYTKCGGDFVPATFKAEGKGALGTTNDIF
jgi:hypothetical protein